MSVPPPPRRTVIPIHVAPARQPGHAHGHTHQHAHDDSCCTPGSQAGDAAGLSRQAIAAPPGTAHVRFRIDAMDCPTEEGLIRNRLTPMPGVVRLDFNLLARELTVHHTLDDASVLESALIELGMAPAALASGQPRVALPPALPWRTRVLLAVSGACAAAAEALAWSGADESSWPVVLLAVLSLLTAGLPTLKKGWIALRHLTLNIYFLMSLALIGAVIIGEWAEAAMVVFLFALAESIEALSLERARKAIEALSALAPDTADILQHGHWHATPVAQVAVGSRMRVRTGERAALDATVVQGRAALNEAPITGESLPVDKQPGDALYAGSIVTDGVVEAEVTAVAGDSTLARIASAIQQAQAQRAPTQRFVDAFARYYTPIVVLLALGVALIGPWAAGGPWQHWLYEGLVMLVIACPCALVVSTPVTVVSGLAAAARHGILIKGGRFLEGGRLLKAVALDKTGTLTSGHPSLTDVVALGALSEAEVLRRAASLDLHSTHPVAKAIVAGWRQREAHVRPCPVDGFKVLAGQGVSGQMDGQTWQLRQPDLQPDDSPALHGLAGGVVEARLASLAAQGKSTVLLWRGDEALGILAVADTLRPTSRVAIERLRRQGVHPVMLTGDNVDAARAVAELVGIDDVRARLLPADKLDAIVALKAAHGQVGMVGDGINDAPALARADIGLAMGAAGTATALESADVAIMDDDPGKIAVFIELSRQAGRILKQNIALALGIKAVFLALALSGQATLWMAVFADMGASLLVVFNGLRLLRSRV